MNDSTLLASIPSPSISTIELGPLTIHYYALCILAGIMLCLWLTSRRWQAWGEDPERVWDIALWAIPLGIVGARAYHVLITDPGTYFGPGADPLDVFKIWEGGIGIMGAISVGGLGAWLACRRYGISLAKFADAAAPGIMLAQAMGRWGNWFNQELFGKPTTLPWGLEISASSPNFPSQYPVGTLFHPTFLYESLWNILGATLLLYLGKKGFFQRGQTFWAYVVWYGFGRLMIEAFLRIDTAEMLWGMRIHVWTSGAIMLLGIVMFAVMGLRAPRDGERAGAYQQVSSVASATLRGGKDQPSSSCFGAQDPAPSSAPLGD
ncbi:prolipoprotein diacylglyceryl transferase [Rothia sp. CCM 9417]|uniref:prolipoprotein diacylglyceryl transferase n=1 Tax=unclassified Rothia (in: high G+C Gram-positive bacteria) TaxID=2689056 RepID=UPI003AD797A6